jgi:hypothetical protein
LSDAGENVEERSISTKSESSFLVFNAFLSLPAPIQEVGYPRSRFYVKLVVSLAWAWRWQR